ncbi:hypothetical protein RDI58_019425 [Solanum bulbocastanum]|uniref:Uncharacterized protein n=1 Tax=Solanum bulbocastanum TaxID=147425 RepID=A0AAN8Y6Z3_SOLBU
MKIKVFTLMPMLVLLSFFHLCLIACCKNVRWLHSGSYPLRFSSFTFSQSIKRSI